jgi:hypothetical protein
MHFSAVHCFVRSLEKAQQVSLRATWKVTHGLYYFGEKKTELVCLVFYCLLFANS